MEILVSLGSANLWHGGQFQCERQPKRRRPDARQINLPRRARMSRPSNATTPPRRWRLPMPGGPVEIQHDGGTILIQPRSVLRSIGLSGLPVSPDNTESLSVIGMGSYPLGNWSPERPGKHAIIGVRPMPRSEPQHGRRVFNRALSDRRNEHSGGSQ
jgi:hypothetical protein